MMTGPARVSHGSEIRARANRRIHRTQAKSTKARVYAVARPKIAGVPLKFEHEMATCAFENSWAAVLQGQLVGRSGTPELVRDWGIRQRGYAKLNTWDLL